MNKPALPPVRTRLSLALISASTIGLELVLMRLLALRFWHHFAAMVIAVALLGFGASGTALTLLQRRMLRHHRDRLWQSCMLFSLCVPGSVWVARYVPLDVQFLAWNFSQAGNVAVLELLLLSPFLAAGAMVGLALMDSPSRVPGHYAANLAGSGAGAILVVVLMWVFDPTTLLMVMAVGGFLAGAILVPWRQASAALTAICMAAALVVIFSATSLDLGISPYKALRQVAHFPQTRRIYQTSGPQGRIDVLAGPAIHHAPGLGLQWHQPLPPHVLLMVDGDQTSAVYDCPTLADWAFMDHTTTAVAYRAAGERPRATLIIGAGGGASIGLGRYHHAERIVALEMNRQIIETMTGPLADRGGDIYLAENVRIVNVEARGYLNRSRERFDVIDLSATQASGRAGAGLFAAQESFPYTVEAFEAMLQHLSDRGALAVTQWADVPPRSALRVFDTAAEALRRQGRDPKNHLAMIRSLNTVTVLASNWPLSEERIDAVESFCTQRGFDLCYLPGMKASQANRFHILDRPWYFQGASALLSQNRDEYLDDYLFNVAYTTDDRPYFHSFFRLRSLPLLKRRLGALSRAYLEVGYLMLLVSLVQSILLAAVLIVLPLATRVRQLRSARGKAATLGYFLALGLGFMLLEVGFLHKLILYLSHPIYSAAVVIGSFLLFSGLGSQVSRYWRSPARRVMTIASVVVLVLALLYAAFLEDFLAITQAQPMVVRFVIAALTILPLAFAMGQMFPTGLRVLGASQAALVPWAWAVNGFASVAATLATPVLAMNIGLLRLTLLASLCYASAGFCSRFLPGSAGLESARASD